MPLRPGEAPQVVPRRSDAPAVEVVRRTTDAAPQLVPRDVVVVREDRPPVDEVRVGPDRRVQGRTYFPHAVSHGVDWLGKHHSDGFFMMVEGSQIDYAGHDNDKYYLLGEMRDFEEMLQDLLDFAETDGNTLVIVTADHSTGGLMLEEGKPGKGNVKFAFQTARHTADMVPVYAFGPGAELFHGMYDNTDIFRKIVQLGRYQDQE